MANTYSRNIIVATNRAAKLCNVDAKELRKHFRNFKEAPAHLKHGLIVSYRIMNGYKKAAVAVEPAVEE